MTELIQASGVNGQVSFDGSFITITRKGLLARATIGKGEKRIPIGSVTAVQWKPPGAMVRGFIQFTVPGGNEGRSHAGRQTSDAAKDENSVLIDRSQREAFERLREAVEQAIAQRGIPTQSAAAPVSVGDELAKLAALHQQGVLSEEEFAAAKARLIGS